MTYEVMSKKIESLPYRDKLRLAQLLIQLARKEEEEVNATNRETATSTGVPDVELIQYVADRLKKLRPTKKDAVLNSIGAMFQFRGGVSDTDKRRSSTRLFSKVTSLQATTTALGLSTSSLIRRPPMASTSRPLENRP
jgi:hypothetical protein